MDWTLDIDKVYLLNIGDVTDYLKKGSALHVAS